MHMSSLVCTRSGVVEKQEKCMVPIRASPPFSVEMGSAEVEA